MNIKLDDGFKVTSVETFSCVISLDIVDRDLADVIHHDNMDELVEKIQSDEPESFELSMGKFAGNYLKFMCTPVKVDEGYMITLCEHEPTICAQVPDAASCVAHQCRQPLSAIAFIVEDIRDAYQFGELDINYLNDSVDECISNIKSMSEAMDDFITVERPTR